VLQGSFYSGNASTQYANLPIQGSGFTASLEAGYPFPLPGLGPGFVLEPQGQIIWQQVSFADGDDGMGPVALGSTSGPSGRLGLRGKWKFSDDAGCGSLTCAPMSGTTGAPRRPRCSAPEPCR
jgi:outer membrane autotransporter protein